MLGGEEAAGASEAGLNVVGDQKRARRTAKLLRLLGVAVWRHVHALALNRLDEEAGHFATVELAFQGIEVAERHRVAARQQRLEALPELRVAVDRQRAEREPVETVVAIQDPRAAGGASGELERRLHRLGAGARQHHAVERRRRPRDQLLCQHSGKR